MPVRESTKLANRFFSIGRPAMAVCGVLTVITPAAAQTTSPDAFVFSSGDAGSQTSWDSSGYFHAGGAYSETPSSRLFAVSGQPETRSISFLETQLNFGVPFDNAYFDSQIYIRTASEQPLTWNDDTELAVPRFNWIYFGDRFDFMIGRIHVPTGVAKSANVMDFFSDNPIAAAFPLRQFERGLRTGQAAIGMSWLGPRDTLFEGYIIPEIPALSFANKFLLSSNASDTYAWLRVSKDFSNGLHLDAIGRINPEDWRVGVSASYGIGNKFILYGDALYRNLRSLPTINGALTSVEFDVEDPNTFFAAGVTYSPSANASFSFEASMQEGGYTSAEQNRLFDVLSTPTSPIFTAVATGVPTDQLIGNYYLYVEADLTFLDNQLRFVPSLTVAQNSSHRVSAQTVFNTDLDGLLVDVRLTGNFGHARSEFGMLAQSLQLTVGTTYSW